MSEYINPPAEDLMRMNPHMRDYPHMQERARQEAAERAERRAAEAESAAWASRQMHEAMGDEQDPNAFAVNK